jgi:tetratricopeptide (TPR) repeat protein
MTTAPFLPVVEKIEAAFAARAQADLAAQSGDLRAALQHEQRSGELCPYLPGHWERMASRYEALGEVRSALESLLKALMIRPDDLQTFSRFRSAWGRGSEFLLSYEQGEILNTLSRAMPPPTPRADLVKS